MLRYTLIYETNDQKSVGGIIGKSFDDKLRIKLSSVVYKTIVFPPYFFLLVEIEEGLEKFSKSILDLFTENGLTLIQSGPGWWIPSDDVKILTAYSDLNYSKISPQIEKEATYKYTVYIIFIQFFGFLLFLSLIIFNLTQSNLFRILSILALVIYLGKNFPSTLHKIICTDKEIILIPMIGTPEHIHWNDITSLRITSIPKPEGVIQYNGIIKEFTLRYGLDNHEVLIKTILQRAKLALSESNTTSMIYLRFNSKLKSFFNT